MTRRTRFIILVSGSRHISVFVLLDLSEGFNTLDHNILLQNAIGIKDTALQSTESCLIDSSLFMQSSSQRLIMEFEKGSVLGLNLLYIIPRQYCYNIIFTPMQMIPNCIYP